jgi:hypothetical protein
MNERCTEVRVASTQTTGMSAVLKCELPPHRQQKCALYIELEPPTYRRGQVIAHVGQGVLDADQRVA